ncbi:MAG: PSD1 domain-containing protein [Planctomycetes bacterium]|nr:PSD1 domain-containing protein [Planctomycetota bacterium]
MKHAIPCLSLLVCGMAFGAEPDRKGIEFFESRIRPVLVAKCYQCHSAKAAQQKKLQASLLLDTRDGMRKGGETGPAIVAGKVEASLLINALRHEDLEMPPKGKLPDTVIADFVKWIEMGAPDPRHGKPLALQPASIDIAAGRKFWSFEPLKKTAPPNIKDMAWIKTRVDQFIRARQQTAGISPNRVARPGTLVRRAFLDLIGLPPSPEELDMWTEKVSASKNGYGELVDHLLGSEHYGERWARHWLDLARFAESNGYAFDKDRPNAYHYRDFVIRALNDDMPYDKFVRLQVAGDLISPNDFDAMAATGFVVAGPFTTQQTQKERERSRYEQLDDMIHTLGTAMLGLTIGCCRCHDHKYDPLPQYDYYRMAPSFAEVGFADVGLDLKPEVYQKAKADFDAAHAPFVAALAGFEKSQLPGRFAIWLKDRPKELPAPTIGVWQHIGPFASDNFDKAFDDVFPPEKEIELAKSYQDGKLKWVQQPKWTDGTVHNTLTGTNSANYLYRVIESPVARKIPLSLGSDDAIKLWVNGTEILKKKIGRGAAPDQEKVELPLKKGRNELLMKIVNGGGPSGFYFKSSLGGPPAEVVALLKLPQEKWNDVQRKKLLDWYKTLDEEWLKRNAKVEEHKKKEPKKSLTNVYAAKVRGSTYNFGGNTYKVYFLRRGNADTKEGEASPGFLQVLMRTNQSRWVSEGEAAKPPRVGLADWLSDVDQGAGALLARVIVNRLWHHHLGRGIVATPSDFGTRGARPTHPQLLDWLADELIRGGWRLKPIHRLIMTSAVYMQDGQVTETERKIDPDNMLFWRRETRRLEAEVIRDNLLAVSGTLDRTMFGKGSLDQQVARRSIYLTVKRSRRIPILQLFDAPDSIQGVGSRENSTVAPQALAMLNSPMVRGLAAKFAARAKPDKETSIDSAIENAYRIALSRNPDEEERSSMKEFIQRQTELRGSANNAQDLAFRDFCHVLLCMNEFIYVD